MKALEAAPEVVATEAPVVEEKKAKKTTKKKTEEAPATEVAE